MTSSRLGLAVRWLAPAVALSLGFLPGQLPLVRVPYVSDQTDHRTVWDSGRTRVVMVTAVELDDFGTWTNEVWEWDGMSWTDRTPSPSPLRGRRDFEIAYDAMRQRTVLFGGAVGINFPFDDTWEAPAPARCRARAGVSRGRARTPARAQHRRLHLSRS